MKHQGAYGAKFEILGKQNICSSDEAWFCFTTDLLTLTYYIDVSLS